MATIERSIEEVIEEYEDTEDIEDTEESTLEPTPSIQRPKKKPRSQKQIEALNKAREARAKNISERKAMASRKPKPKTKQKQRVIVLDSSSSEEEPEPLVIKRKKKKTTESGQISEPISEPATEE